MSASRAAEDVQGGVTCQHAQGCRHGKYWNVSPSWGRQCSSCRVARRRRAVSRAGDTLASYEGLATARYRASLSADALRATSLTRLVTISHAIGE